MKLNLTPTAEAVTRRWIAEKYRNLGDADGESLILHYINEGNYDMGGDLISTGSELGKSIPAKMISRRISSSGASSFAIIHNHIAEPNSKPSKQDDEMTKRIHKIGEILGIQLFDSFIICRTGWFCYHTKKETKYEN